MKQTKNGKVKDSLNFLPNQRAKKQKKGQKKTQVDRAQSQI